MKLKSYSVCGPMLPQIKQHHILGAAADENAMYPIAYLQRPKWIEDDAAGEAIVKSIRIELPVGFEIK